MMQLSIRGADDRRTDPTDLSRRSVTRHHFIYRRVRRVARCRRALPTPRASEEEGSSGRAAWPSKEGPPDTRRYFADSPGKLCRRDRIPASATRRASRPNLVYDARYIGR